MSTEASNRFRPLPCFVLLPAGVFFTISRSSPLMPQVCRSRFDAQDVLISLSYGDESLYYCDRSVGGDPASHAANDRKVNDDSEKLFKAEFPEEDGVRRSFRRAARRFVV